MKTITAKVLSVYSGEEDELHKDEQTSIIVELDGVVGDRHRSFSREAWAGGDKQPEGTVRRNERQWSAVSVEELAEISEGMDLTEPLTAGQIGANLCVEGIPELSRLPKGTIFKFPSGAELQVEEFNPPCLGMGTKLAESMSTNSGKPLENTDFSKTSKLTRGIVGVVEVAGIINPGDEFEVTIYEHPSWLARAADE
jgi:MOSC domain-containing protein YiiM